MSLAEVFQGILVTSLQCYQKVFIKTEKAEPGVSIEQKEYFNIIVVAKTKPCVMRTVDRAPNVVLIEEKKKKNC